MNDTFINRIVTAIIQAMPGADIYWQRNNPSFAGYIISVIDKQDGHKVSHFKLSNSECIEYPEHVLKTFIVRKVLTTNFSSLHAA